MASGGGGKDKIEWVKQPVPKFIQDFKQRTNQKESPTVDSKHQRNEDEGDDKERDDETPLVCVTSDITAEEAESFIKESYGDDADVRIENPNKRGNKEDEKSESSGGQMTFKKPKEQTGHDKNEPPKKKKSKMKKVKNTKLLSFGDQDDDEEE
ncbi:uncharacterized protein KIAA1143 homolog [Clytia hemisphaerica]|uniref:DUF4604 domain-containing protein n=1 Tax=Clytia hemisphaerica TaxID=252671 RepID=A0A7M5WUF1_9CNID